MALFERAPVHISKESDQPVEVTELVVIHAEVTAIQ